MNANELAEAMEIRASIRRKATSRKSVTEGANDRLADQLEQAATMLRQQQAEIEALKQSKSDGNNKVNTEPVAWMQSKTTELPDGCECMQSVSFFKANDNDIPLYTHPAKDLTDEEV